MAGETVLSIHDPLIAARFWSKVDKSGPAPESNPTLGACWVWTAATQSGKWDYGVFHPVHGQTVRAHRYSLEQYLSRPLSPGSFACHHCDTPRCVRPDHLYEGESRSNVEDAVKRGRHKRGAMDPKAKLTDDQVIEIRERANRGEKNRGIAAEFGIQESLVSMIAAGKRWAHVGGPISSKYKKKESV